MKQLQVKVVRDVNDQIGTVKQLAIKDTVLKPECVNYDRDTVDESNHRPAERGTNPRGS